METFTNFKLDLTYVNNEKEDIKRNIELLFATFQGTCPLSRGFGLNPDIIDKPTEVAKTLFTADVANKIAQYEPRVRVVEVQFEQSSEGILIPKVVLEDVTD